MNKFKQILTLALGVYLTLSFCACADHLTDDTNGKGGQDLTPDLMESIQGALSETAPDTEGDSVYWLEGGSVYHLDRQCRHLSGKTPVQGTVQAAVNAGKKKACSACGSEGEASDAATDFAPSATEGETYVYWVKDGQVLHGRKDCPHVSNASKIKQGSTLDAAKDGVFRHCTVCMDP